MILVFEPNAPIPNHDYKRVTFERIYRCNFLDHNQVKELRNEILQNVGPIDILIENGKSPMSKSSESIFSFSPDRFIEETSNKIIITLNVSDFMLQIVVFVSLL